MLKYLSYLLRLALVCLALAACNSGPLNPLSQDTTTTTPGGSPGTTGGQGPSNGEDPVPLLQWSNENDAVMVGRLVDQLGNPIPMVAITFARIPVSLVNYTDANGNFSISQYPLGKVEVKFEKFGHVGRSVLVQTTTSKDLGAVTLPFGDADDNGTISPNDVGAFEQALGVSVNNSNRFMDYNGDNQIGTLEFNVVSAGLSVGGLPCSEWLVSKPDYVSFIPSLSRSSSFTTNQHYQVTVLNNNKFFGIWTGASTEAASNQSILCHWSKDEGKTWSDFNVVAGPDDTIASYGFMVYIPEKNRIYVFFNRDIGTRIYHHGFLSMKYSDDEGETWSREYRYTFTPGEYTPKDQGNPPYWWVYQSPIKVGNAYMVGFTEILPHEPDVFYSTEIRFLRFDNIASISDPDDLQISTLPENGKPGLRWPTLARSQLQEPSIVQLSDGRLFCLMRANVGSAFFSVSSDNGETWTFPAELHYGDGLPRMDQPWAPCPLYKLNNSTYVLVFNNNRGTANEGQNPSDYLKNRTPSFVAYAKEDLGNTQPLTFSSPIRFLENYVRPFGPDGRTEIGTYPSLTFIKGFPTLWYPDRKHFLLGKRLPSPQ